MHTFTRKLSLKLSFALLVIITSALPAAATPQQDLAYAVQEAGGGYKYLGWITERLMTFQVGAACHAKLVDRTNLGQVSALVSRVKLYAKQASGEDWDKVERQTSSPQDTNRKLVDKMITEFAPKFHLTIEIEGDDCSPKPSALWLVYANDAVSSLTKYPPKSGQMAITIKASAKAKQVTAEINKDGTALVVTGPRDVEPSTPWGDIIGKAIKRVSTKN